MWKNWLWSELEQRYATTLLPQLRGAGHAELAQDIANIIARYTNKRESELDFTLSLLNPYQHDTMRDNEGNYVNPISTSAEEKMLENCARRHFMQEDPRLADNEVEVLVSSFADQLQDYCKGVEGDERWTRRALAGRNTMLPHEWWQEHGSHWKLLQVFALKFMSAPSVQSLIERFFSGYATVHTRARNRLSSDIASSFVEYTLQEKLTARRTESSQSFVQRLATLKTYLAQDVQDAPLSEDLVEYLREADEALVKASPAWAGLDGDNDAARDANSDDDYDDDRTGAPSSSSVPNTLATRSQKRTRVVESDEEDELPA